MHKLVFCIAMLLVLAKGFDDFVSVTDYGAVADSMTPNDSAFKTAFAAARQRNLTRVYVPAAAGFYLHTDIIEVSGIHLFGDGYGSWLHGNVSDKTAVKLINSNSGVSNLRLTSVDQDRQSVPWSATVWCFQANNFTVDSVWVEPLPGKGYVYDLINVHGVGGIFIYGCSNGIVSNNSVQFTYADAIHHTAAAHDITTSGNKVENSGDDGVAVVSYYPGTRCYNIVVSNNTVKNAWWGRGLTNIGGDNVIIEDNFVENCINAGIWLASEKKNNGLGHDTWAPSNTTVRRNVVHYATQYKTGNCSSATLPAMGLDISTLYADVRPENINFVDNVVMYACRPLFRLSGEPNNEVTVAGNTFVSTSSLAVYVSSNAVQLHFMDNSIDTALDNAFVGINNQNVVNFVSNTMTDVLLNTTRIQVVMFDGADQLLFANNTFTSTRNTNARRILQITTVSNFTTDYAHNDTLLYSVPSAPSFEVPTANDFTLSTTLDVTTIDASVFVEHTSGEGVTFVIAYGATGGKVDAEIDRSSVTFTFNDGELNGSFKYVVKSSNQAAAMATVTIQRVKEPSSTNSPLPLQTPLNSVTTSTSSTISATIVFCLACMGVLLVQ